VRNGALGDGSGAAMLLAATGLPAPPAVAARRQSAAELKVSLRRRRLRFEANRGQATARAQFVSCSAGYELDLSASEATPALPRAIMRMKLASAKLAAAPDGRDEVTGKVNHDIGNDPSP